VAFTENNADERHWWLPKSNIEAISQVPCKDRIEYEKESMYTVPPFARLSH
jgi:hypothetical protein